MTNRSWFDQWVLASEQFWRDRNSRHPTTRPPEPLSTRNDDWLRQGGPRDPNAPRIENGKPRYFG